MGLFSRVLDIRAASNVASSSLSKPAKWLSEAWGGAPAASGVVVNDMTALQTSTVYACVGILAESLASLPWVVYRRTSQGGASSGKERDRHIRQYELLHDQPNPEMTSFEFRETGMGHLGLRGNFYAEMVPNNAGDPAGELWPIRPDRVTIERATETLAAAMSAAGDRTRKGELVYRVTLPSGQQALLSRRRMFHVRGFSLDGITGLSPIGQAREAIGLSMATEEYGARFFSNGAQPAGVLTHPEAVTDEAKGRMRKSWEEIYGGLKNKHRIAILEEGVKYQQLSIPNEDSQFLDTRKFQVEDIARFYRVPLVLLGHTDKSTSWGTGIEQFMLGFVTYTLRPWVVRWEQAARRDLFSPRQKQTHFSELLVDGLLRGDLKSRYEAYAIARQNGWLNANEIRGFENQNPRTDAEGDAYWRPANMLIDGEDAPEERRALAMALALELANQNGRLEHV